jgi:MFS family permease
MLVLFLTVLIDLIGFGMIIPILPFAAPRFGATELDIALILVTYSVCGALASPLWGRLSDRWGRKKTLLSCLAGTSVCYVLLAFVTQLWMLYAVRIVAGCFTGNFGVASAYAADLSTPETQIGRASCRERVS